MSAERNQRLARLASYGCLGFAITFAGCRMSSETGQAGAEVASRAAEQRATTVDPAKIEKCGGFTAEKAAQILGVPAGDIQAASQLQYETLRICSFQSRSDSKKSISFSLGWEPSAEEAKAQLARTRENLGVAQRSIGRVTGSDDKGPALEEISGLGDEAYYTQVNDTLVVRVSNVSVQIMSAPNLDAYKQVGREVAEGLR